MKSDPAERAAWRAFVADSTAELEQRRVLFRDWLLDVANHPAPHRGETLVGILTRGLDAIESELHRREQSVRDTDSAERPAVDDVDPFVDVVAQCFDLSDPAELDELFGTPAPGERSPPRSAGRAQPTWELALEIAVEQEQSA